MVLTKLYEVTDGEKLTHYLWLEFFEYAESRDLEVEALIKTTLQTLCENGRTVPSLLLNGTSKHSVGKAAILEQVEAQQKFKKLNKSPIYPYRLHRVTYRATAE